MGKEQEIAKKIFEDIEKYWELADNKLYEKIKNKWVAENKTNGN